MKKVTGWIMFCIAAAIIAYNVNESKEDEKKFAKDPWVTLLSDGANLSDAYSFTPPYSGFEVLVISAGLIGIVLIVTAKEKGE